MSAVLFGSISTVADTSELQREAFNSAFSAHGLDWRWDRDEYRSMLSVAGGRDRIAAYARSRHEDVDAAEVHRTKSRLFQESVATASLTARPGVAETLAAARTRGDRVGLVTTTHPENVTALLAALAPTVSADDFDVIVDSTSVGRPKPDGAAYAYALERLDVAASDAVAIEDNVDGIASAKAAAVTVVAFPNENTAGHDFAAAAAVIQRVDLDKLDEVAHLHA